MRRFASILLDLVMACLCIALGVQIGHLIFGWAFA